MSDTKLVLIAACSLLIAAFIYAVYISNPPLIDLSKLIGKLEEKFVESRKIDPAIQKKLSLDPNKTVRMYISFKDNSTLEQLEKQGIKILKRGKYVNYAVVEGDFNTLQKLIEQPGVQKVIDDGRVRAIGIGYFLKQVPVIQDVDWNIKAIKADIVQQSNITGEGAVVAVIDTGVNYKLPDLDDNYLGGYDFAYDDNDPMDGDGHGTEVASIIVAEGNKYTGVAPEAKYFALKALNDNGWGNWSDVIAALEWVLDQVNQGKKIDIISMSLGADLAPSELQIMCQKLYDAGVILVAASGNAGERTSIYPAAYDTVISVAATDINGRVSEFSNGGAYVAAPGVQVVILGKDGNLYYGDGTSFAAPHVSGVLALIESQKDITPSQAFTLLQISTDEIDDPEDKVEYGQINAVKAVNNALNLQLDEGGENWYDILYEPQIQVLIGILLLAVGGKIYVWMKEGGDDL